MAPRNLWVFDDEVGVMAFDEGADIIIKKENVPTTNKMQVT